LRGDGRTVKAEKGSTLDTAKRKPEKKRRQSQRFSLGSIG
jgi:hypothetical protein